MVTQSIAFYSARKFKTSYEIYIYTHVYVCILNRLVSASLIQSGSENRKERIE